MNKIYYNNKWSESKSSKTFYNSLFLIKKIFIQIAMKDLNNVVNQHSDLKIHKYNYK